MEDVFSDLKNCLLEFEYPLATSMTDDQIADVFSASNRCFLVAWVVNLMKEASGQPLKFEKTDVCLGNLLFEMRLCEKSQSIPFMRGELPLDIQLRIIQNLFKKLKCISQSFQNVYITHTEMEYLQTMNLNIFPMYGDIKCSTSKVKNPVNTRDVPKITITEENEVQPERVYEDFEELFQRVKAEIPNITSNINTLEKQHNAQSKQTINLDPSMTEVLKKCDENLRIISQFFKDYGTIMKFKSYKATDLNMSNTNSMYQTILKNIYSEFLEICKYSSTKI